MIKDNEVLTSRGEYCLNGVTRGKVIEACRINGIYINEVDFTVEDVHKADEAFVTGTFAGIIPVINIDGIQLSLGVRGELTRRLQSLYSELINKNFDVN